MKKQLLIHDRPVITAPLIIRKKHRKTKQVESIQKSTIVFPLVQMPEQPERFLRAGNYDCY